MTDLMLCILSDTPTILLLNVYAPYDYGDTEFG